MTNIKYYFKASWLNILHNKGYALFCVLGTTLTFIFITFLVHIKIAMGGDYTPMVHSGRIIKVAHFPDPNGNYVAGMTRIEQELLMKQIKEYESYSLTNVHYTNVVTNENILFSNIAYTNAGFWDLYTFDFIAGQPFTAKECENRKKCAVITKNLSTSVFHTANSVGKKLSMLGDEFEITGVVTDFSIFASPTGSAEIWTPFIWNPIEMNPELRILFSAQTDLYQAKETIVQAVQQFYNLKNIPVSISVNQLLTEKEMKEQKVKAENGWAIGLLIFIFLLTPAVNIITLNKANTQNRAEEIAIRRTFGASRSSSFFLILFENLILSFIGTFVGILLAESSMSLLLSLLFDKINILGLLMPKLDISVVLGIIMPLMLLFILLFSGLPAWLTAKRSITVTLKGGEQ